MSAHPTRRTLPHSAVPFRSMLLGGLLVLLSVPVLRAESGLEGLVCRHGSHGLLAVDADAPANGRHYAPDRTVDIGHVAIDITPDFESRTLRATTTLRAHPVARPLEQLTLDAVDLRIDRVESSAPLAGWTYDDRRLVLTFSPPVALDTEVTVTVAYGDQVLWPDHCVQGTDGAAFHPALDQDRAHLVIRKGFRPAVDSYSAFFENYRTTPTGLSGYLRERGIDRVFLTGLATDVCVRFSAMDARNHGFDTILIADACRGLDKGGVNSAVTAMKEAGVRVIESFAITGLSALPRSLRSTKSAQRTKTCRPSFAARRSSPLPATPPKSGAKRFT